MSLEYDEQTTGAMGTETEATFSVREINEAISLSISSSFPQDIWVKGEVQRLRFHASGHIYFDLIDSSSKSKSPSTIPVTLLKWNATKIKADLREILVEDREVRILAKPDFYAPYGKMSLAASNVDSAYTLGQIAIARRELIEKLRVEGILKNNSEIVLENLVTDIALVTSIDSAAYHDVVDQLKKSELGFKVIAINALMQGSDSVVSVARALKYADNLDVDAILLCRGGGAKSDLATFDNEKIARTITSLNKPLLTGLGHQIDVSVSDMVSNRALKTPTACAQFLIERTQEALDLSVELTEKVNESALEAIETADLRLANVTSRLGSVDLLLERAQSVLTAHKKSLIMSARRLVETSESRIVSISGLVNALDPMRVIERGFSVLYSSDGSVVRNTGDVKTGDLVRIKVADGQIDSQVIGKGKG
ncbi:MAG TPA: exodeoxyribonuclease VII large subunit [Acidimicrobiia bacterium]|nr:exodeoxyribonuclease VII large subunit [Acidimicrobiia bacterium]